MQPGREPRDAEAQPVAKERRQRRGQGDGERDRADRQQAAQSDESHKPAHGFLLHLPVRGGCSYRMGASTPTCPNASHNRSYARNLSYSWRTLGGSSYWHSEPVQHPCRCQSNAVNQRPHEHWDLNGRSGSVMPVSRCRMSVESSLDGTDLHRTRALDIFITVRPVASAVSVGLPPSPESRRRTVGSR